MKSSLSFNNHCLSSLSVYPSFYSPALYKTAQNSLRPKHLPDPQVSTLRHHYLNFVISDCLCISVAFTASLTPFWFDTFIIVTRVWRCFAEYPHPPVGCLSDWFSAPITAVRKCIERRWDGREIRAGRNSVDTQQSRNALQVCVGEPSVCKCFSAVQCAACVRAFDSVYLTSCVAQRRCWSKAQA